MAFTTVRQTSSVTWVNEVDGQRILAIIKQLNAVKTGDVLDISIINLMKEGVTLMQRHVHTGIDQLNTKVGTREFTTGRPIIVSTKNIAAASLRSNIALAAADDALLEENNQPTVVFDNEGFILTRTLDPHQCVCQFNAEVKVLKSANIQKYYFTFSGCPTSSHTFTKEATFSQISEDDMFVIGKLVYTHNKFVGGCSGHGQFHIGDVFSRELIPNGLIY